MKLLHTYTGTNGKPATTWDYTDNPELNERINTAWAEVLQQFNWWDQYESVMIQFENGEEPEDIILNYDLEHGLYHHVKKEFMYNYGGLPRELNQHLDYMIDHNKIVSGVLQDPDDNELYDARVELYTKIVCLFQEFGGIPKVSTN